MLPSNKNPTVTVERRRHYRISSGLDAEFTIGLVMPNGLVHAAMPVDISVGGVCLWWPREELVGLNVGQRVKLRIHPSTADAPVTIQAAVRWTSTDVDGNTRYGLEFENLYEIFEHIMPILWRLCHGRKVGQ
ncbi:MAG TPA: PilZ domain-containing protein [bacterium]|jgi:c-di-GMP-binding flagellar brake protein YcgR